ncbi:terpene synthase family protein [Streptomyces sp. NPDC087525]|uniref:terpene synthase family protein n=1 Tax=Streptomyces sp. NPDC087525 TaxID=3365793 RepID=UPI0037FD6105
MTSTDHPADYPGAVLTYGMEYRLPDISVRLPLEVAPGYQEMRPRVHAWARRYLLEYFGENEQDSRCTDSFLRQGMCYWTAACWPDVIPERQFAMMVWGFWGTLSPDDMLSHPATLDDPAILLAVRDAMVDAAEGRPRRHAAVELPADVERALSAATRMCRDGQALIARTCPRPLFSSITRTLQDAMISNADPDRHTGGDQFPTFEAFQRERRVDVFGPWMMAMCEWTMGVDLDGLASTDPDLAQICSWTTDHFTLVNDIYSFPKELAAGEQMNTVWFLMHHEGLSLQQSLDWLADRAALTEQRFTTACDEILAGPLGHREDVRRFVRALGQMIAGNVAFHLRTSRYFDTPQPPATPHTSPEPTVLYRRGTVHQPLPPQPTQHE